jgi:hypothetical protein
MKSDGELLQSIPKVNMQKGASAIVAYTSPFRLIFRDAKDSWAPSLEQINQNGYDSIKLHRLSTSIDIGLPQPFCCHVTFDGALLLPRVKQFWPIEKAVAAFNRVLGEFMLGGVYFESIGPTDIDQAILYPTGYYRPLGQAKGLPGQLRYGLQAKMASPLHSILLYQPEHLLAKDLHVARKRGAALSSKFETLSLEFLVQGISAFATHDWAGALSHLWISLEQVVSCLWKDQVIVGGVQPKFPIRNRKEFLQDHRTWVTSARLEVLFQRGILSEIAYRKLNNARKARNELAHLGRAPSRESASAALEGLFEVIESSDKSTSLAEIINTIKSRDPLERYYSMSGMGESGEGGLWLGPLPPIPGEPAWGVKEYERVYDKKN